MDLQSLVINNMENLMLETAKKYLEKGASVMPVGRNKIPCLKSWAFLQERHPTIEELEKWWTEFPEANVGVITGKISQITVVDVDKGGDTKILPTTDTVRTGGGGYHFYYQYYEGYRNKGRILPFIDIRGDGGYVVAPPSIHQSGNRYEVVNSVGKQPFPIYLFGGEKPKTDWEEIMKGIPQGGRNVTATQVIGKLLRTFAPVEWETVVYPMVQDWNSKNTPALPDRELRLVFNSISSRERRNRDPKQKEESDTCDLEDTPPLTIGDVIKLGMEELDNTKPEDVVSFGYPFLDEKLTGIFKGELVIVGGESGTGKTTFVTNMVMRACQKHKVMIFALEDRLQDYGIKAVYFEMGKVRKLEGLKNYPWNNYRRNDITDSRYLDYRKKAEKSLENENMLFENCPDLINLETLEKIIEKRTSEGVDLFVIDHLHYFDLLKGNSSKADYVEKMMIRIKKLQVKTGARMIMIAHYRKLDGKKPSMDSFKDSISICQNANYVINLWRNRGENHLARNTETKIMIPKSRNPNGEFTITANFNPETNDLEFTDQAFGVETANDEINVDDIDFGEEDNKNNDVQKSICLD